MSEQRVSVSVIGLGYIGLPTAAVFASNKVRVFGVDVRESVVDTINEGRIHIEEEGLDELVKRCVSEGMLSAHVEPKEADAFIIAVPTPIGYNDNGTYEPDISYIQAAGRAIAPVLKKGAVVILESTSPVGTTGMLSQLLGGLRTDLTFPHQRGEESDVCLAYCPERIIPGKMLHELVENDRTIGGMTPRCAKEAARIYKTFVKGECHLSDDRTAEMVKLTENAFRDVNIAFANELSMICDGFGIDPWEVIGFANRHPRVSILNPGPGVGGHCIAVDPWFIVAGSPERAQLIRTAREVNDEKPNFVVEKVERLLEGKVNGKVACLGLSYKPDVDDFRESPSLDIAKRLSKKFPGQVVCSDPFYDAIPVSIKTGSGLNLVDLDQALSKADVVVMLVGHSAYRGVERPKDSVVVDTVGFWR